MRAASEAPRGSGRRELRYRHVQLFTKIIRTGLVTEQLPDRAPSAVTLAHEIERRARALFGRALAIREVDAGSCNGCELEIAGLPGPVYDMERFGLHFVASPRHADMLLVTGPVTRNMAVPLRKTYDATPDPKLVVAIGDCGCTGGIFGESYASCGRVANVIPVDVAVPGCPPAPAAILQGILTAVAARGR